jgi:hypothetical protein
MTIQTPTAEVRHPVGPDGLVVVRVRTEDVAIRGVDGGDAVVRARGDRSLGELEVDRGERSLEVRTGRGRGRDLEIEVPRTAHVVVEAASSDIRAHGLAGDQRFRVVSGDLEMRDVHGNVHAEAVSGDIDLVADGPSRLDLRTMSGDVAVRAGVVEALRVTTTSGDIRLAGRLLGDGPFAIETVSGDVILAPAGDLRVEIRTITGDVRSESPSRLEEDGGRRTLAIGSGGPTVAFRSTSGDLRIVRALSLRSPGPTSEGRVGSFDPPAPPTPPTAALVAAYDDARLGVLRALERGDIDVAEAGRRLEALDGGEPLDRPAGPPPSTDGPLGRPGEPEEMHRA